jgi:hypothetical protein
MSNTLLTTILIRTPGPWSCHCCGDQVLDPRHADEGPDCDEAGDRDRIYCASCAGCDTMTQAHSYCDCCYAELDATVEALGDPVLIEATRKVLGFDF